MLLLATPLNSLYVGPLILDDPAYHVVQVSIVALKDGQIRIVQSSMLGSILSNILLVLGCCFLAGGIHNTSAGTARGIEQDFNSTVASTMSSLMAVASASLIIPATVRFLHLSLAQKSNMFKSFMRPLPTRERIPKTIF